MSNAVPDGWGVRPLSELATIDKESLRSSTDPDYEFRYIDIASVKTGKVDVPSERVCFQDSPSRARKVVRKGDVLMSTVRPNLQAFAYFDEEAGDYVASTGFAVIRANGHSVGRFLYQSILSDSVTRQVAALVAGSNYPAISSSNVKELELLVPPLPEQQKIAAILSSVDDVIEKTRAQIDKLKDLKTGMMQELLTKGIGHTAFKDSPVGRIPEGWEVRPLIQFSKDKKNSFVNGPFGSDLLSSELTESGVPVIYVRDLKSHKYERVSTVCVTELKADSLPACAVEKNDVLVAKVGDPPCNSGVYEFETRSIVTQDVIRIRPSHDVDPYYLSYLLNSPLGRKQIEKIEIAGTRTRVSLTDFKKLLMPYPSSEEQRYLGQTLRSVDIKIWSLERKENAIKDVKKALMQDLLTGKVRVNVDNKENAVAGSA